jgi:hypothetical protein
VLAAGCRAAGGRACACDLLGARTRVAVWRPHPPAGARGHQRLPTTRALCASAATRRAQRARLAWCSGATRMRAPPAVPCRRRAHPRHAAHTNAAPRTHAPTHAKHATGRAKLPKAGPAVPHDHAPACRAGRRQQRRAGHCGGGVWALGAAHSKRGGLRAISPGHPAGGA